MAKDYWLTFGTQDPRTYTGLAPTFVIFQNSSGSAIVGPTISEPGTATGFYKFTYSVTTQITFLADGGAAVATSDRYVKGILDPIAVVDQKVGASDDSFGSTSVDPTTMYGLMRRIDEWLEGNASYNKTSTVWSVYSRGSSTLLREKTLTNSSSTATKA